MKRWCFTEHGERAPVWWTWRVHGADGSIEQVSQGFATYGEAVADAISKGFRARDDYCVLETRYAVVRFGHAASAMKSGTRGLSERGVVPGKNRNRLSKVAAAKEISAPRRKRPGLERPQKRLASEQ